MPSTKERELRVHHLQALQRGRRDVSRGATGVGVRPVERVEDRVPQVPTGEEIDAAAIMVPLTRAGLPLILEQRAGQLLGKRRHHARPAGLTIQEASRREHRVANRFARESLSRESSVESKSRVLSLESRGTQTLDFGLWTVVSAATPLRRGI